MTAGGADGADGGATDLCPTPPVPDPQPPGCRCLLASPADTLRHRRRNRRRAAATTTEPSADTFVPVLDTVDTPRRTVVPPWRGRDGATGTPLHSSPPLLEAGYAYYAALLPC
jgi:hypothetical protein